MNNDPVHIPLELDLDYYESQNADLDHLSTADLITHFYKHGIPEGRAGSAAAFREAFLKLIPEHWTTLEIGPFFNPAVEGPNVRYMDVFDQDELRRRAQAVGADPARCPHIDFVSSTGEIGRGRETFDCVVSSHCIEHQPDLVAHLNNVHDLLVDGGRYFILISDKRYCADRLVPETNIADVLDAHIRKRQRHEPKDILSHVLLSTHGDPNRHWGGDHGYPNPRLTHAMILHGLQQTDKYQSDYIDTNAWHFTPAVFKTIVTTLKEAQLCPFTIERIYNSPFGHNEFTAILRKVR